MEDMAQYVLQALVKIKEGGKRNSVKRGIIDNINGAIFLTQKIRKYDEKKTIGFFGAQKRGKSSLINQLLGCELMPAKPIPMSSVVIKTIHDNSYSENMFIVDIIGADGTRESNNVNLESAQLLLTEYGSHKGSSFNEVDTIEITSNFVNSEILKQGGILVDTPGAEVAFDPEKADVCNDNDAKRAIDILSSTHVIIFVERADLIGDNNSKTFFVDNLKKMRPLTVVNWKDIYQPDSAVSTASDPLLKEAQKQHAIREEMLKTFNVNLERTLCVSCKEAKDAKRDKNEELLRHSNLPLLEKRIADELANLTPEHGLITVLSELDKSLSQIEKKEMRGQVFSQAQRPFHVLIEKAKNSNNLLYKKAKEIYDKYR